jgi:predicted helicase
LTGCGANHRLHDQALESETERLEGFYESVQMRGRYRQRRRQTAHRRRALREVLPCRFPRTAKALGIVYTPTQIVDFVLRAANDALHGEFGTTLSQPDVHILGTGTGTFIVRLTSSRPD